MFSVTEAEAATIRAAFDQDGELSAAVELRRIFPVLWSKHTYQLKQSLRTAAVTRHAEAMVRDPAAMDDSATNRAR